MKLELDDKYNDKHQKLYLNLTNDIRKALAAHLTEEDKEDLQMGYISTMALMRIAANMAIALNISKDGFLIGCANMFKYEEHIEEKSIDKTDLN